MAKQKWIDCTAIYNDQDISGDVNQAIIEMGVEEIDTTAWSDTARRRIGALGDARFSFQYLREVAAEPIDTIWNSVGGSGILTLVESNASMAEGDYCQFGRFLPSTMAHFGEVSGADGGTLAGVGDGPAPLGRVLQQTETLSATGNSTGFQLGAVAAGQSLWAAFHVITWNATTLDMKIQSDDAGLFGSPTDQITFTQATGTTSEFLSVAGPITDDFWRVDYTLVGTSAVALVVAGIF